MGAAVALGAVPCGALAVLGGALVVAGGFGGAPAPACVSSSFRLGRGFALPVGLVALVPALAVPAAVPAVAAGLVLIIAAGVVLATAPAPPVAFGPPLVAAPAPVLAAAPVLGGTPAPPRIGALPLPAVLAAVPSTAAPLAPSFFTFDPPQNATAPVTSRHAPAITALRTCALRRASAPAGASIRGARCAFFAAVRAGGGGAPRTASMCGSSPGFTNRMGASSFIPLTSPPAAP